MASQASSKAPAWGGFLIAGLFLWGGRALWEMGRAGDDFAAFCAVVAFFFAAIASLSSLTNLARRQHRRRIEKRASKAGRGQGQARWATLRDLRKVGMLNKEGLFLGQLEGRDLHYPGETTLLTIAPPGAGKGVCFAVPTLLRTRHSMIVTDPKGELYAMTHRFRRDKLGQRIIALAPWAQSMSAELGSPIADHGFNPLSVIGNGASAKDDAELVASLMLPPKAKMSASDEFWNDGGQTQLSAFLLYLIYRYDQVDLPLLRATLLAAPEVLFETLCAMSECDAFEGALQEYGGKLLGTLKNAPQQFEGAMGSAQKALRIYDKAGLLAKHVSHGEIDFAALKHEPTTIYLIIPSERAGTHAAWLNLVISLAIELVGRDRSSRKVTFLLDEFCNLGYLPNVLRGMAQYRSQGVQAWLICQQISQLDRLYGIEGRREIMGMAEIVNVFGAWEPDTLKMLSTWLGNTTQRQLSTSITPSIEGGNFGFNVNASDYSAPLMRPEDIRIMPSDEQLIFYRNLPPIRAKKISYLTRRAWKKAAAPNPYHRKS
jgi:type IV secretion system protein VirD4